MKALTRHRGTIGAPDLGRTWLPVQRGLALHAPFARHGRAWSAAQGTWVGLAAEATSDKPALCSCQRTVTPTPAPANAARVCIRCGLRVEGAATNLCAYSADFGNAAWAKTNAVVDADEHVLPHGETGTTCELRATAGNATVIYDAGVIAAAVKTFSVYLKRKTGTGTVEITLDGGASWTAVTPNGVWERFQITQTLADPDIGVRIVTSGDEVLAWGAQLEDGRAFATTLVPTAGASAQRTADDIRIGNAAAIHVPAAQGTIFVLAAPLFDATDISADAYMLDIRTAADGVALLASAAGDCWQAVVRSGGGDSAVLSSSALAPANGTQHALALTWAVDDFRLYVNGALEANDAAGAAPTAIASELFVGQDKDNGSQAFAALSQVVAYDRVLGAQEIEMVSRAIRGEMEL